MVLDSSVSKTPHNLEFSNLYLESEEAMSCGQEKQRSGTAQKHSNDFSIDSLPTSIPSCMSLENTDMYILKVRIEEITQKLSKNLVVSNDKYHYRKLVAMYEKVYVPVGNYLEINF
ncbi:hypothetical protein L873DRAFT_1800307, partial [Choiromyces venosus 120613-1]